MKIHFYERRNVLKRRIYLVREWCVTVNFVSTSNIMVLKLILTDKATHFSHNSTIEILD